VSLDVVLNCLLFAQDGDPQGLSFLKSPLVPFLIIGLMFYLLLIRPEQRKRAKTSDMLGNLKKNDHVLTIGGIHGVVVNVPAESDEITIRVDENNNTRLHVLRSAISKVVTDENDSKESD
jgi:preprotein translocase subunit YajC